METRAWIEIDLKVLSDNIEKIKSYTGRTFMACVKGDCYGMGIREISRKIEKQVSFFGVATTSEGIKLREVGIRKPVIVLGPILPGDVETLVMNDIRITLFNVEMLKTIAETAARKKKKAVVHIKVDTGLGRIGVKPEKAAGFIEKVIKEQAIKTEGIFTHFATAGWEDKSYARKQLYEFNRVLNAVSAFGIPLKHIANSPAILNLPETYENFDMIRIGLLTFGVYPNGLRKKLPLECALKGFCRAIYIKTVPGNTPLSYGITYKTARTSKIVTTGIGYADGLRRMLSNNFHFLWHGKKVKIVGNICMDQTIVDATGKNIRTGDLLQIFGDNFEIEKMAEICKTVPQEILCGFGSERMKKVYK